MIDLVMWLIDSRPVSAQALGNDISSRNNNQRHNSFAVILLQFENGVIANVTANFGSVTPHHHTFSVYSKNATFTQKYRDVSIGTSRTSNQKFKKINFNYLNKNKSYILKSFIESIIFKKKPVVTKNDVLKTMAISLAIEKSIKSRKWEKVVY